MSDTFHGQFLPGKPAEGMTYYYDHYQDQQRDIRIVLNIAIEKRRYIQAILDTGTPWCIFNPLFFELLGIPLPVQEAPHERLLIRGTVYAGWLLLSKVIATFQSRCFCGSILCSCRDARRTAKGAAHINVARGFKMDQQGPNCKRNYRFRLRGFHEL